jgi:hypothetical protein
MTRIFPVLMAIVFASPAAAQSQHGFVLRCSTARSQPASGNNVVLPTSTEELGRLGSAPHGAKRIGKRRLEIHWTSGKRIFTDTPPYDEPLDGIWWAYCEYDARVGMHHLLKQDRWLFTGALLNDRTGALLPAGQTVLFSPDLKFYLAYEQPDGQDGETIKLYTRGGILLWKGYNGILTADGKSVVAESSPTCSGPAWINYKPR